MSAKKNKNNHKPKPYYNTETSTDIDPISNNNGTVLDSVQVNSQTSFEKEKTQLINFIESDKWDELFDYITKNTTININEYLINGNNIYHIACVKGNTNFIKKLLSVRDKIKLNTNLFNTDGLSGAHLYYKYGGVDPFLLTDREICYVDDNDMVLAFRLLDKIDLLEMLIDRMIDAGCAENIGVRDDNVVLMIADLMGKINYYGTFDKQTASKYVKILDKLYKSLKPSYFVFVAIHHNCIDAITILMQHRYDFNTYLESGGNLTPVGKCIISNRIEMLVMILTYTKMKFGESAVFKLINTADIDYDMRPVFIAIDDTNIPALQILVDYMKPYIIGFNTKSKNDDRFVLEYTDGGHNTYLHRLLLMPRLSDVPHDTVKFFIDHCDLDIENYAGVTSAHILFGKGVWRHYKDSLEGREINLLKVDDIGNNCYSYIKQDEKEEFMAFVQKLKVPIKIKNTKDVERMFDVTSIKQMLKTSAKEKPKTTTLTPVSTLPISNDIKKSKPNKNGYEYSPEKLNTTTSESDDVQDVSDSTKVGVASIDEVRSKNYGLFNANLGHYMLYLRYLENKHSDMFVPTQIYDKEKIERDLFFFNTVSSYITSNEQLMIVRGIRDHQNLLYSYLPHKIYWLDDDCYYVHHDLQEILTKHNNTVETTKQRYVMLKLSIVVTDSLLHANVLIYDRQNREAWRFEPYGTTRLTNKESMDKMLKDLLQRVYGEITYYEPDDFLNGLNFQMVDGENYTVAKNLGDPGGYCLAWSLWFVDIVLSHQDKDVKHIMRNFFTRGDISSILSDEEGEKIESTNYYLDFIRRYAHKLDNEKNIILTSAGVKKYYLYNAVFNAKVLDIIKKMFRVLPVKSDIVKTEDVDISSTSI